MSPGGVADGTQLGKLNTDNLRRLFHRCIHCHAKVQRHVWGIGPESMNIHRRTGLIIQYGDWHPPCSDGPAQSTLGATPGLNPLRPVESGNCQTLTRSARLYSRMLCEANNSAGLCGRPCSARWLGEAHTSLRCTPICVRAALRCLRLIHRCGRRDRNPLPARRRAGLCRSSIRRGNFESGCGSIARRHLPVSEGH